MKTIDESFMEFHNTHPEVFNELVHRAREVMSAGYRRYNISALWERMRWTFDIEYRNGEEFKYNNNFRSRYSRKIMEECEDLKGFFEVRVLKSKEGSH